MSSGSVSGLLQGEGHSEIRPRSFTGLYHMRSGTFPEQSGSGLEKSSGRDDAPNMRFSLLLIS